MDPVGLAGSKALNTPTLADTHTQRKEADELSLHCFVGSFMHSGKKGLYNKINNLLPDLSAPQFQEGRKCRDYSLSLLFLQQQNTMCRNLSHKRVFRPPVSRKLTLLDPIHPESAELGVRDQGSFTLNE